MPSGDMTRPTRGYGDDELGEVARALDGAIQELGRRVNELAHDRRHLRAILAGMVEGVIVIDAQGRLVMANGAARAMLKLDDSATGRRYQEWMRQSELFAELAMALRGEAPAGVEFVLARDPSRTCVARAAPAGAPEGRRRARPARHQRPAARRSRAPRLRRQCLARAPDAADGDPRVCRGVDRRPAAARRESAIPRDHRAPHRSHGAAGQGPASAGAARRRTGNDGDGRLRSERDHPGAWRTSLPA